MEINAQGFAYIEFLEADAVENALHLDNSELRGRNLKVPALNPFTPFGSLHLDNSRVGGQGPEFELDT